MGSTHAYMTPARCLVEYVMDRQVNRVEIERRDTRESTCQNKGHVKITTSYRQYTDLSKRDE